MSSKQFVLFQILFLCFAFLLALSLKIIDIVYNENDLVRHYQLTKLYSEANRDTINVILGSSAAGNTFNAKDFTTLSQQKTLNLALTGSFGFVGIFNMLQRIHQQYPELKNVIIMPSLVRWSQELRDESIFEISSDYKFIQQLQQNKVVDDLSLEYLSYYINLKEIYWFARWYFNYKIMGKPFYKIENDYWAQKRRKYSNGLLKVSKLRNRKLSDTIQSSKQIVYKMMVTFCEQKALNCIFVHGPTHTQIIENSPSQIQKINQFLEANQTKNFIGITRMIGVENAKMGDSINHIDPSIKDQMTRLYFTMLEPFLHQ
ncbi:MAG TPA: hypothetical protein DCM38_02075 [Gammaproteobacteria bacterium]|nr:hypothetical protein [Gammaproteobacteria bacterium]